jgi:integrase/recombinase XerD
MQKEQIMKTQTSTAIHVIPATACALFGDHLGRFRQHLVAQHYAEDTVRQYMRCIGALAEMMQADHLALEALDEAQALELIAKAGWREPRRIYATFMAKRFVRFLSEQGVGKPPLPPTAKDSARTALRRDYEVYLRRQRGLSERTIFQAWRFADRFLAFRFGEEIGNLAQISSADITDFLQHLTMRTPPLRDKTASSSLRNFFRYLFQAGTIATNLAAGIPSVAQRYGTRLPRHLTLEQVESLLGAVRTETPRGRRNYAMVLLLARLGLRPPEVIAMQIDDIDWRSGEIVVRGKGDRHDRLPLLSDVGEALANYIRLDRVTTSRALFVTERSPHRPFKDSQVLNAILQDAFASTGLTPPPPYVGAHILRHSLATNLVQGGASLEEISETLRHRSRATTLLYARLDLDGLRSIAQPWPVAGGGE